MTAWETTLFLQSYAKLYIYSHVRKYLDAKYWRKRHCRSDTQVSPRRLSNAVSQTNDSLYYRLSIVRLQTIDSLSDKKHE